MFDNSTFIVSIRTAIPVNYRMCNSRTKKVASANPRTSTITALFLTMKRIYRLDVFITSSSVEGVKNKTLNCQRTSNYPGRGRKKRLEGSGFVKIEGERVGARKSRINARSRKGVGNAL